MKRTLMTALLGTALIPGAALAQSPECDRLLAFLEGNQAAQATIPLDQVRTWQRDRNEAECTTRMQQVAQAGQQPAAGQPPADSEDGNATPETQEGAAPGAGQPANIVVQQPAPTVTVDQAAPQITVQQPQPNVTVRQPQPEIIVRQPPPVVTIDIPQPEIIVRMPQPEVTVQQAQPQVQVQQPQPQVRVEQPQQPQVQVQEQAPAQVQVAQPEGQAPVQVEQTGEPRVTYERAEPQVNVNQAEGQPTVRIEPMQGGQPPAGDQAARDAAAQQLRDSEDPNRTPETQEGQQPQQQQAAATQQGQPQQPAAGGMQQIAVSDLDGVDVINERGEQLGDIESIVQSTADQRMYAVIAHGGFLGLGEKRVALSLDGLAMQGDRIVVPGLTDDEIRALPEFQESDQYPEVEDNVTAQVRTMAAQQ